VKEFYLPIARREENLERASDLAFKEAITHGETVYADFLGVPLLACQGEGTDRIRDNWRKLFDQLKNSPEDVSAKPMSASFVQIVDRPARSKAWAWYWQLLAIFGVVIVGAFFSIGVIQFFSADATYNAITVKGQPLVTYNAADGSIRIDVDLWAAQIGCADAKDLHMLGGAHRPSEVLLKPACLPNLRYDSDDAQ
jgi:hypothetical protein